MSFKDDRAEQAILEYQSRLDRIDSLYQQASSVVSDGSDAESELQEIRQQRDALEKQLEKVKTLDLEQWREGLIESAGPLAVWDVVAQKLEDLIEKYE